jgi:hypothetical protein
LGFLFEDIREKRLKKKNEEQKKLKRFFLGLRYSNPESKKQRKVQRNGNTLYE